MNERPCYVYVASPLSGDPGQYLANVAGMSQVCRTLLGEGFVPVNPSGDLVEGLCSPDPLPVEAYQRRSLALLELVALAHDAGCPAALYVVRHEHRDGRPSAGVAREIRRAHELGLPVVSSLAALQALAGGQEDPDQTKIEVSA